MTDPGLVLATGLALGAAYALLGVAVSAVALATRTLHLAVGQILVAGVVLQLLLGVEEVVGVPGWVALPAALLAAAGLSALLQPLVLGLLRPGLPWLVGLAVAAAMVQAGTVRWLGTATLRPTPLFGGDGTADLAGLSLPEPVVVATVVGLPAAVVFAWAVRSTGWGRRLRLVGGSTDAAAQAGIRPGTVRAGALAASGAVAVLAGLLVAPIAFVGAAQGAAFTIRGVAAAALLGSGGPLAAIGGGLLLGLTEGVGGSIWPQAGGEVAVALVVLAVLALRGSEASRAWGRAW